MPRSIQIATPTSRTGPLLDRLSGIEGVAGVHVQRGASISPPGDVIELSATNDAARVVMTVFYETPGLEEASIQTSELKTLVSRPHQHLIGRESNEATWEEMATNTGEDANPQPNFFAMMLLAGIVAAVGLWQDQIHLVIGAMVIAPGFEPIQRISLGAVTRDWALVRRGLVATLGGYALLALGAALTYWVLRGFLPDAPTAMASRGLVQYWASIQAPSVLVAMAAGAAGAVAIAGLRPTVFPGVMIALALIPSMSLVGMGAVSGEFALVGYGLAHFSLDLVAVLVVGALVFAAKRARRAASERER